MDTRARFRILTDTMLLLLITTLVPACGPDPCSQVDPEFSARRVECGGEALPPGTNEHGLLCTEERARTAQCQIECIRAADCDAFVGADASAVAAARALGDCMADCQRKFEG